MSELLIGIDVGTTSTKVILIAPDGRILAERSAESELFSPSPGWAEANPEVWWKNVAELIPICLHDAKASSEDIAAIGVSGMVPAVILLDGDGGVLRPSIQQNDARAIEQIDSFRAHIDEREILAITGSAITQQSVGPKLLWIQQNEPHTWNKIEHMMGSYDYVNYCLTGELTIEQNWALESGLYSLEKSDWLIEVLALADIHLSWLGRVCRSNTIIGEVTRDAAKMTGLREGTPVVAGSADHVASAFSAGMRNQGHLLVKLGGAGDILYVLDEFLVDERLYLDYHVIPDKFLLNGCMAASGSIIRWFRDNLAPGSTYELLDDEASHIAPGAEGLLLLPYFLGEKTPLHDPQARGILTGLSLSHTRAHIYRAVLEGISFGFLHHLEVLQSLGLEITETRVTNGGSRSKLWPQITSDVLGLPLEHVADHPGSSLGAAFAAGMGVGVFREWDQVERFIDIQKVTEPNDDISLSYQEIYPLYRELYEINRPIFHQMSQNLL